MAFCSRHVTTGTSSLMGARRGEHRYNLPFTNPRLSDALRPAKEVELHHGDVAMFVELEIGDFKHGRAFAGTRTGAGQLNNDLLGVGIQGDRCNLE